MLVRELIELLEAEAPDARVILDVVWPFEMYDVDAEDPIHRGGDGEILLQTGDAPIEP